MSHASPPVRTLRSPIEKALLAWLASVLAVGAIWLWAVSRLPDDTRHTAFWAGGVVAVAFCAATALASYFGARAAAGRRELAALRAERAAVDADLVRAGDELMPELVRRVHAGATPDTLLADLAPPAAVTLQRMIQITAMELLTAEDRASRGAADTAARTAEAARLADETLPALVGRLRDERASLETALAGLERPADAGLNRLFDRAAAELAEGERRGTAAMAACANAAARVQAQTTSLLAELRELQHRYGDDKVFGDLLDLDHRISQMGRLADSIALLSGGRSGRRWTKPIVIESILRGAMGRIDAYQRVRPHLTSQAAIVGYAAEGVMHALAELLDNAATFSSHNSEVHVYVEEEDAGLLITIEDGGLGMRKRERQRAESLVAAANDLKALPGTRLGLAVVGRLAAKHGFSVSFRPSARGGTGVILLIPRQLVTRPRPASPPAALPAAPIARQPGPEPETDTLTGLPKRPRGATLAAAGHQAPSEPVPAASTAEAGSRFAAFRDAGKDRHADPAAQDASDAHPIPDDDQDRPR